MFFTTTDDEINTYLNDIKELIKINSNNLIISSRDTNLFFMQKYGLKKNNVIRIINSLCHDDFKEKVNNKHVDYSNEILYIFSKTIDLVDVSGKIKSVILYIKFNLLADKVILISFHEARYKFEERK